MPFGNKKDIPQSTTAAATTAKPVEITTEVQTEPITEEVVLSAIKIETPPAKVKYFTGDTLDITGLVLSAEYSDGISETVTNGFEYSPEKLEKAGSQEITVTLGGKTATFTVEVHSLAVTSVKLKSAPKKTSYYAGDFIDTTGLELTVAYNNGKSRTVKDGFE
ncbi:MAG: bacterial Ig-like domain-containing protein, partial [Clostridia bacterium]|nr:bacterial Ig-like domain-containing protein [Clostridia bacterium]